MNKYLKNLNKIEFVVTTACTGSCKHCSEGGHSPAAEVIDADAAERAVRSLCKQYSIQTVMTFGGEPLLNTRAVCAIHSAASDMGVPNRQIITNGFFSNDDDRIAEVAALLAASDVNDIRLSVDAFHQETIPIEIVKAFAQKALELGLPIRTQPAWLVSRDADNPYNAKTREILAQFSAMGTLEGSGNVIFPQGNALKYLKEYFKDVKIPNPYVEDPYNVKTVSVAANGNTLGGNIVSQDILDIIAAYTPPEK